MQQTPADTVVAAPESLLIRIGNFFFKWRNLLFTLVYVVLLVGFRPVPFRNSAPADRWMDAAGVLIILLGQGLRAAVIGLAYIVRGGKHGKVYAEKLVTEGVFRHCRNPLYVGNLLVLLGLFVIHNSPWVYLLGVPFFLFAYSAIVAAEEAYLRRQYGTEYDDYCRRVPRWLINVRCLRASLTGMRFNWAHVVLLEYGSTVAWFLAVVLLLAYEALTEPPFPGRSLYLAVLAFLFVLPLPFWIGHERWKPAMKRHRKRLDTDGRFR
jgi:protein-S-isoprenylcysteine O-methyltransferase Ste14